MHLKLGVSIADRVTIDQVIGEAKRANLPVFTFSTGKLGGRAIFIDCIRATLPLGPLLENSRSWDTLADSLWEGIRALDHEATVMAWLDSMQFKACSPEDYEIATELLNDVAVTLCDSTNTSGKTKTVSIYIEGIPNL